MKDYSNFSQEAIIKDIQDLIKEVKKKTGASDEEISLAFQEVAFRIMDTNCFLLPGGPR